MPPFQQQKNPMYVETSVCIDKREVTHTHYFLRQSRREGQKIIKTTILNITGGGEQNCEAFATLLKNKKFRNISVEF
ncbi:MAG: hypothetical protein LBJ67_08740, partial [Planctomycetaceae bacterium]|nr:hypothetical protein [Planctomycetaceae bacterium]